MTRIVDLSDDPRFTIKTVATQTGIRPVTLRAWERRHEVLNPHRADNHYRLYSERDIAILRWLKNRVDEGVSISSAVSELRSMTSNNIWPESIPVAPVQKGGLNETPPALYARQLYQALIRHDETRASDLLREIHSLFDLFTIFMDIIVPSLRDIGEAWYRGEVRVTTEHFASAYLRGKLLSLLQAYPARRNAPSILIGCAPMEQHELGSLMMAVLLRSEGYRVEYLGPDLPVLDLVDYASYENPAMIILSASLEDSAHELRRIQEMLQSKVRPAPIFGYGGRAFDLHPELIKQVPGHFLGSSLKTAVDTTQYLLKNRSRLPA
jgi:MerR family transcriptional regulator, light-induced transcriptional regulator